MVDHANLGLTILLHLPMDHVHLGLRWVFPWFRTFLVHVASGTRRPVVYDLLGRRWGQHLAWPEVRRLHHKEFRAYLSRTQSIYQIF